MNVLNIENLIQTQSQKHRERLLSQFSRFTDSAPSFPLYFSIDGVNSSTELGTRDIMSYVGDDSPVKFKKINNTPIFALNPITANIIFDEVAGGYTEYEDQGLMLNSVLRPLPGDHFILPEFNPEVIFAITEVSIRLIRGEDHYAITYSVVPASRILDIEKQVVETYETIFRNIGTEDKVLIRTSDHEKLNNYIDVYGRIVERYTDENYNTDFGYLTTPTELNSFIGLGTCKYLIRFLKTYRILYFDEILDLVLAFEEVLPFEAKHNKLYVQTFILNSFINRKIQPEYVYVAYKSLPYSLFTEMSDTKLEQSIEFKHISESGMSSYQPMENEIQVYDIDFIKTILSKDYSTLSPLQTVIAKYTNNEDIAPEEFESIIDDYDASDIFRFYFIPCALFALKIIIKAMQSNSK